MTLDAVRAICQSLPHVTEDIKWGNDLCFLIGEKMFCVAMLSTPFKVSLKVLDDEFEELICLKGIIPAPYAARHKWILVEEVSVFNQKKWEHFITQSYNLVKVKLPKKKLKELR